MLKLVFALLFAAVAIGGALYFLSNPDLLRTLPQPTPKGATPTVNRPAVYPTESPNGITTLAEGLDTPWAIGFLPDGSMLITERSGNLRLVDAQGRLQEKPVEVVNSVEERGEGGLLGIAIHPQYAENKYIYLYYTYGGQGDNTLNRVSRYTYDENRLSGELVILDQIPGASNHNGGRIRFGPDGMLYIGTGDAQEPSLAQNTQSLAGKILRVTDEGRVPSDNPFPNHVFSYGHRNVQGLAWSGAGELWATEHGRSGVASGLDEVNLINGRRNYGWPEIEGDERRAGMESPKRNSGGTTTWAPSGAEFVGESLFFSGLRGRTLYEAVIQGDSVTEVKEHFNGEFGRIREVIKGPDGALYITTSNRDGRGVPGPADDRLIRINPEKL